jgi:LacI family transcriptional regulator
VLNDSQVAYEATISLLKEGRKRIALLTTDSFFSVSNAREEGYRKALVESDIPIDETVILRLPYDKEIEGVSDWLSENKIDGVLAVNEIFGVHCLSAAHAIGLKIPADLSVIGFTDGILSKYSVPKLTTVAQHGDKMGEMAAKLLIEKIETDFDEEDEVFTTEVIQATIIRRESTIN